MEENPYASPIEDCVWIEHPEGGVICVKCGVRWTHPIRRNCKPIKKQRAVTTTEPRPKKRLNWKGRILIRMKPGRGLAWVIKYSGMKALAAELELIQLGPDGECQTCLDREAWIEMKYQQAVHRYCSEEIPPRPQAPS